MSMKSLRDELFTLKVSLFALGLFCLAVTVVTTKVAFDQQGRIEKLQAQVEELKKVDERQDVMINKFNVMWNAWALEQASKAQEVADENKVGG